ncbi:hypothetical protein AHMF7616_01246 [Adhaeribacter pallidiroseus]|uniref:Uncharacterized protein n=2 Tax=Adhaeribacter pallidiroseus TaxID=2072847 RepID=A0A369QE10_9BACT|nr:hypothetical protein AHMF7616_01246 [Adhaeribacter pallidiroseus]
MERFVIPHLYGANISKILEQVYAEQVPFYFVKNGFPPTTEEQDLSFFKKLYRRYMGIPFKAELNDQIEQYDYINPDCHFCEIGRTSKLVQDSGLLSQIDQALKTYDRVMVTFGPGHAIALELALSQIFNKKR